LVPQSFSFACRNRCTGNDSARVGKCLWIATPLPHAPLPAASYAAERDGRCQMYHPIAHQSGQLCPTRMIPRAPQDGRKAQRCYSSWMSF
jgi:hypothetical protein